MVEFAGMLLTSINALAQLAGRVLIAKLTSTNVTPILATQMETVSTKSTFTNASATPATKAQIATETSTSANLNLA